MAEAPPSRSGFVSDWTRPLVDPQAFRDEQRSLEHVWTFLGLSETLKHDGDWFRATIGTRSVFVQRFGNELRGFENLCVHRFHPLRTDASGHGPVICGFHHWQYNKDGRAVGVPICNVVFGKPPHELKARLRPIDVATCGAFVFGRFPAPHATESLEHFLGDTYPILTAMVAPNQRGLHSERLIHANWKLNLHVALDEYHGPAVHPTTFGRHGYGNTMSKHRYFRLGHHSAYCDSEDEACFSRLLAGCRDGTYRSKHYFVLQILPNLTVAHAAADGGFWFCNVLHHSPVAHDLTTFRGWIYPAPFESGLSRLAKTIRPVTDPIRQRIYRYYFNRVVNEDASVCERLQTVARQVDQIPILSAREERIGWFEEAIRALARNDNDLSAAAQPETGTERDS